MFLFKNSTETEGSTFDFERAEREYIADIRTRYNERRRTEVPTAAVTLQAEGEAPFADPTYLFWAEESTYLFFPSYMSVTTRAEADRADKMQLLRIEKNGCSLKWEGEELQPHPKESAKLIQIYEKRPIHLVLGYVSEGEPKNFRFTAPNTLDDVRKLNLHIPELCLPDLYNILNLPQKIYSAKCADGTDLLDSARHFTVWREGDRLNFLYDMRGSAHTAPSLEIASIPLEIIEYYAVEGSVSYEEKISGGGGGELNVKGAIIGDLLFGTAGAILGGKTAIREVRSDRIEHDDRLALLSVLFEGQRHLLRFDLSAMDVFHATIPEKDYETLALAASKQAPAEQGTASAKQTIPEQIEHLARLKESGILTEEEFADAKKALLAELTRKI